LLVLYAWLLQTGFDLPKLAEKKKKKKKKKKSALLRST